MVITKQRAVIAGIALLPVIFGIWWMLREKSPEEQIAEQLEKLCGLVSRDPDESNSKLALRSHSLQSIFTDSVEVSGDAGPFTGGHSPVELSSIAFRGRVMLGWIDLTYTDLTVSLQSPDTAAVSFTAKLRVASGEGPGGIDRYFREVAGKLRKEEDQWLFSSFTVVKVLGGQ